MKYIGTSWKMNHTLSQGKEYAASLAEGLAAIDLAEITPFIIPPFTSIQSVRSILPPSVLVGAQNMHWKDRGAYTGEISAPMLKELGVELVELGHSERRDFFNETDEAVGLKAVQALTHHLRPLICIGEPESIKDNGQSESYLQQQVHCALKGVRADQASEVLFAYEPIWAIGEGGVPAEPDYVARMVSVIKQTCSQHFPENPIPVLYGGSVSLEKLEALLQVPYCDGLFIGRAAWTASKFLHILERAVRL